MREHPAEFKPFVEAGRGGATREQPRRGARSSRLTSIPDAPTSDEVDRVWEDYLAKMAIPGGATDSWGDQLTLKAFSMLYGVRVFVHHSKGNMLDSSSCDHCTDASPVVQVAFDVSTVVSNAILLSLSLTLSTSSSIHLFLLCLSPLAAASACRIRVFLRYRLCYFVTAFICVLSILARFRLSYPHLPNTTHASLFAVFSLIRLRLYCSFQMYPPLAIASPFAFLSYRTLVLTK
jgi:hypothetical protein